MSLKGSMLAGILFLLSLCKTLAFSSPHHYSETQKLYRLGKVWGYLKYYSPVVGKGELNWDSCLIKAISISENRQLPADSGIRFLIHAAQADRYKLKKPIAINPADTNIRWIQDTALFGRQICLCLMAVYMQHRDGKNYYTIGDPKGNYPYYYKELPYRKLGFPPPQYRLLALFRVWNIVNYFYPYRNMLKDWDSVLYTFIPKVSAADTPASYGLVLSQLLSTIEDSHTELMYYHLNILAYGGKFYPPFEVRMIENKPVVTDIYDQVGSDSTGLQLGDVIIKRPDMTPFPEFFDSFSRYIKKSNATYTGYTIANDYIFPSNDSFVRFTVMRKGKQETATVKYLAQDPWLEAQDNYFNGPANAVKWLKSDVAYINLCKIHSSKVDSIFRTLLNARAIVLDIRGYPVTPWDGGQITKWLLHNNRAWMRAVIPDFRHPGRFKTKLYATEYSVFHKHYMGQVLVLVNERTKSLAEGTVMRVQTADRVTTIGTQTAGSNGPASRISTPGNIWFWITESGIEYPDGTPMQRKGVKIDVHVNLTVKAFAEGRDEVLEKALQLVK